jgi:hypothetical protein
VDAHFGPNSAVLYVAASIEGRYVTASGELNMGSDTEDMSCPYDIHCLFPYRHQPVGLSSGDALCLRSVFTYCLGRFCAEVL